MRVTCVTCVTCYMRVTCVTCNMRVTVLHAKCVLHVLHVICVLNVKCNMRVICYMQYACYALHAICVLHVLTRYMQYACYMCYMLHVICVCLCVCFVRVFCVSRVGQNQISVRCMYCNFSREITFIYTVHDCPFGDFPAKNIVYTPYMHGSGQPYSYLRLARTKYTEYIRTACVAGNHQIYGCERCRFDPGQPCVYLIRICNTLMHTIHAHTVYLKRICNTCTHSQVSRLTEEV